MSIAKKKTTATADLLLDAGKRAEDERRRAWNETLRKLVAGEPLTPAELQMVRDARAQPLVLRG